MTFSSRRRFASFSVELAGIARSLAAGLVLGTFAIGASAVVGAAPIAEQASAPKSSSAWLRTGEAHQQRGEHARAGEAYRQALLALSERKRKANEGARAAVLSAEAYWSAFEADASIAHLDAGIVVLEEWLALTGPQSKASLFVDVQRMVSRLRAVRDPLVAADEALGRGDVDEASAQDAAALDALATQDREWSIGASLALRAADELVSAYDAGAAKREVGSAPHELEKARELLVRWKQQKPADDASPQGSALEQRLVELEQRIAAEQRAAAEAEEQRAAALQAEEERRKREQVTPVTTPPPSRDADDRGTLGIVLLSSGVVAVGAGAGLLAEGLLFRGIARDDAAAAEAEADRLEQSAGGRFDRRRFDASLADFEATSNRRNLGFIVGGSVLAAGGIATAVVGAVWLGRARSSRRASLRAPALVRVTPIVSTVSLQLSMTARF